MKIRNLEIGEGQPCRIIAELGTLHLSSYENLMRATRNVIAAGADLVKTQLIDWRSAWWGTEWQIKRYQRLQWEDEAWEEYFQEANAYSDTPVFASVFDTRFVTGRINEVMPAWKLGYKARLMPNLVEETVQSNRPIIVSIGGAEDSESTKLREKYSNSGVLFQFVQPLYPLPSEKLTLPKFGEKFPYQGLSIHSRDFEIFRAAMVLGSQTLEVHVQGQGAEGPDTQFALTLEELERLVALRDGQSNSGSKIPIARKSNG